MPKLIRLTNNTDATTVDYLEDKVVCTPTVDGDEFVLLSKARSQNIRGVWLSFEIEAVFEEDTSTGLSAGEFWQNALSGDDIDLAINPGDSDEAEVQVMADLSHEPTLYASMRGNVQRGQSLRLKSAVRLDAGSATLSNFTALIDAL